MDGEFYYRLIEISCNSERRWWWLCILHNFWHLQGTKHTIYPPLWTKKMLNWECNLLRHVNFNVKAMRYCFLTIIFKFRIPYNIDIDILNRSVDATDSGIWKILSKWVSRINDASHKHHDATISIGLRQHAWSLLKSVNFKKAAVHWNYKEWGFLRVISLYLSHKTIESSNYSPLIKHHFIVQTFIKFNNKHIKHTHTLY